MTRCFARLPMVSGAAFAVSIALVSWPAWGQGTSAQREACAPDAIKLCSDAIPDVPKTTACMKRHYRQLSPACRVAFDEAVPGRSERPRDRVVTRESVSPPAGGADEAAEPAPERVPGLRSYEAHIRQICRDGLVDSFTCRNTLDLLKAGD